MGPPGPLAPGLVNEEMDKIIIFAGTGIASVIVDVEFVKSPRGFQFQNKGVTENGTQFCA